MMNVMPGHWPCPQHICQHDQHPFYPHPYHPDVGLLDVYYCLHYISCRYDAYCDMNGGIEEWVFEQYYISHVYSLSYILRPLNIDR